MGTFDLSNNKNIFFAWVNPFKERNFRKGIVLSF